MSTSSQKPAGYDIDLGNECSRNAYAWSKKTFTNRAGKPGEPARDLDGGFANEIRFGNARLGISSDGIGTKIEVAERVGKFDTLGYDLVAMTADDLIVGGFVPTNLSNIIDVNTLDYEVIDEMMRGLHDACNFAGMAITGGEIAELGSRIGGWAGAKMNFNWCSTAIGSLHPSLERPLSGAGVKAGQAVVALHSPSFRSNGFSLARRTLQNLFGDDWHLAPFEELVISNEELRIAETHSGDQKPITNNQNGSAGADEPGPLHSSDQKPKTKSQKPTWGEVLLAPSLIYSPGVARVLDAGLPLYTAAHVTGGGIADNFKRVLKNGVGAELTNLFEPLPGMQKLTELAGITPADAYLYWNMGNGMLLVTDQAQADAVTAHLQAQGYEARVAGRITAEPGIRLKVGAGELNYEA